MALNPTQIILEKHLSPRVREIAHELVMGGITKDDYITTYGILMSTVESLFKEGKIILKRTEPDDGSN